ncbi:MAG: tetratricopeptide repeat protein [Flavobacteriales bacterium]|nr:tetratricopeptide repeat protein [Flavobacteriales bacterium]
MKLFLRSQSLSFLIVISLIGWSFGCVSPESDVSEKIELSDIDVLNQQILDDPNNSELYFERALQHKKSLDYTTAFNDLDRALDLDSTNSEFHTERGSLLYTVGRVGEAKFALEKAMELDPDNVNAKLTMAEIYFVLTNHDRSMRLINHALRIDDQLAKAYFLKGLIYKEQNNSTLQKSSLQTVTELDPDNVEAFNLLGMAYASEDDALALQYYESALSIDSANREVLYNRAHLYQEQLKTEEALWAYGELLRHYPSSAIAHYNSGYIYLGLKSEPTKAVDSFTEAIRLNPEYYQSYYNRGVALEELGRIDQAIEDYQRALDISPNFEPAIEGLNRLN